MTTWLRRLVVTVSVAFSCEAASAETSPLNIRGIEWDNCVEFIEEMVASHKRNGFGEIARESTNRVITIVMTSQDEILTLICDRSRRPIIFDQSASPY